MDEFERWADSRDRDEQQSISAQYVPTEMTGYQDLDSNGSWQDEPDYGWVWTPRTVAVDWAPYRFGSWRWIEPWGWTWIDDAPLGVSRRSTTAAGATVRGVWVWVPGRRTPGFRPVYAPALVVFVGGPRFGVSHAAWFPLGPREIYRPVVPRERAVHSQRQRDARECHEHQHYECAVRESARRWGKHCGQRRIHARAATSDATPDVLDAREIEQARVIGATAPIPPRRESVMNGSVRFAPPARVVDRSVVVRNARSARASAVRSASPRARRQSGTSARWLAGRDAPARHARPSAYGPTAPTRARQEQPAQVDQPRRVETPVEQPRRNPNPIQRQEPARPVQVEQPRPVPTPAPVEQPRRMPIQRQEPPQQPAPQQPAAVEPRQVPRQERPVRAPEPRQQPAVERPRREEPRKEEPRREERRREPERQVETPRRSEPRAERPQPERARPQAEKKEKNEDKPDRKKEK